MYTEPELDHSWLMSCAGFDELSLSVASEKLAEVGLRRQMAHHPMRVHNPRKATVFHLPGPTIASMNFLLPSCEVTYIIAERGRFA